MPSSLKLQGVLSWSQPPSALPPLKVSTQGVSDLCGFVIQCGEAWQLHQECVSLPQKVLTLCAFV